MLKIALVLGVLAVSACSKPYYPPYYPPAGPPPPTGPHPANVTPPPPPIDVVRPRIP
ncbi:hypothetical protein [Caulobacter sp. RHG1]|uniref:hypothetical protein n=1 Tax=Caulobacter sp. (strain RHG1) TaxID=2545762 RepID=UPI001552845E|nr:hypothetical protein [Caulobacter sp. RHG1]NQE60559.1 hypothetical protein [Caulobacter sp. RHG1]